MTVNDIIKNLGLTAYTDGGGENVLSGCYIGDLLSLAMSKVGKDNVWITIQTNVNIVAVASLTEAGCVILADGCVPDDMAVKKAQLQDVVLLGSSLPAYELAVKLAGMGL